MIRTLRHLICVDICYAIKSTDSIKDELSKFKKEVNDCLKNELKRSRIEFKIEIHRRTNFGNFIRYVLKEKNSAENWVAEDEDSMFEFCRYASIASMKNRVAFQ